MIVGGKKGPILHLLYPLIPEPIQGTEGTVRANVRDLSQASDQISPQQPEQLQSGSLM